MTTNIMNFIPDPEEVTEETPASMDEYMGRDEDVDWNALVESVEKEPDEDESNLTAEEQDELAILRQYGF